MAMPLARAAGAGDRRRHAARRHRAARRGGCAFGSAGRSDDDRRRRDRHRLGRGGLDAHRPHRLAHDFLGELLLAFAVEEILRALVGEDHQDRVADRRHVGLDLVGRDAAVELERDADLRVAVDVLVGEVDDEGVERQVDRHVLGIDVRRAVLLRRAFFFAGSDRGRMGCALLEVDHRARAEPEHQHEHRGGDQDELLLRAADHRRVVDGGFGHHCRHRSSFGHGFAAAPAPVGAARSPRGKL